ncbi:MAG TPA: hypothetical protein VGL20_01480, partial [Candidatus Dormibacteraeota bacterium]
MSIRLPMARAFAAAAVLALAGTATASGVLRGAAAPPPPPLVGLFSGGAGTAAFMSGTDADGDGQFIRLTAPTGA